MAKKTNLKSVRLSNQVMDYVISFKGDGFNQKFENLVLFCMEQEEAKKQRLESLNQQITRQYKNWRPSGNFLLRLEMSAELLHIWNVKLMTYLHLWISC